MFQIMAFGCWLATTSCSCPMKIFHGSDAPVGKILNVEEPTPGHFFGPISMLI
jgi:hypothetical protein